MLSKDRYNKQSSFSLKMLHYFITAINEISVITLQTESRIYHHNDNIRSTVLLIYTIYGVCIGLGSAAVIV